MNCARHIGKALLDSVSGAEKLSHTLIGRSTEFHVEDVGGGDDVVGHGVEHSPFLVSMPP